MTSFAFVLPGLLARLALAALAAVFASCSGGVSGPPPVNDPSRITILPGTATLYSGLPTTFTISGGTGAYIVSSSNQAVVAASGPVDRNTLIVVPANVVVDTAVTLTVRDTGTAPVVTASLTVRPGTVSNDITVTPSTTQGGGCAPAVCSGGDAIVSTTISQGGNPLPARGVRLEVVSGDFRFITSPPGSPEVLAQSTTVVTDQAGGVHARIRVLPGAPNQTAVLQVTDLGTGAFQRATFSIAQATGSSPGFFAVPDTVVFTGPNNLSCAQGTRADVFIFGGSPPYNIGSNIGSGGAAFSVSQSSVSVSGGSFYVVANGICAENVPIPIVDAAGRTTTVTVSNVLGLNTVPALVVSPDEVTLSDCNASATVTVAGGIPNRFTVSNNNTSGAISAIGDTSAGVITITRRANSTGTSPLLVGVASGDKVATITVNLTGDALNTRCDGTLSVRPSTVSLAGCGFAEVLVSGGTGSRTYTAISNSSALRIVASSDPDNIIRIERIPNSTAPAEPVTVTVHDESTTLPRTTRTVTVNVTDTCP